MTLKQQQLADVSEVFFNTDDFAETVLQFPEGGSVGVSQLALVNRHGRPNHVIGQEMMRHSGLETVQEVMIDVQASVNCSLKDRWQIDGQVYETSQISMVTAGVRRLICRAVNIESQHRQRGGVL